MENQIDYFGLVDAYLPFVVIGLGVFGNTCAFLVFRLENEFKKLSAMTILSFIVVVKKFYKIFNLISIILSYSLTHYHCSFGIWIISICITLIHIMNTLAWHYVA